RMFVALSKRRQDLRQEARIRIDDLLVQADRVRAAALGPRELRANQRAPQRTRLAVRALLEVILGTRDIPGDAGLLGQLAIVVRDARRLFACMPLELTIRVDRLLPLALALVDIDQLLERLLRECLTRPELREQRLRSIEKPCAEIVLGEREQRLVTLRLAQPRPRNKVLMHADRAVHLAAAAKQVPEREVRLERLVIDLRHLDEQLERLVRLAVQDEIEAANIVRADGRGRLIVPLAAEPLVGPADARREDQQPREHESCFSRHLEVTGCAGSGLPPRRNAAPSASGGDPPKAATERTPSTRRRSTNRARTPLRTQRRPARRRDALRRYRR